MEVETRGGEEGGLSITHHSVPYFVPLDELSEDLNKDIAVFVQRVRDYLSAYVCRRQQAFQLQVYVRFKTFHLIYVKTIL